MNKQINIISTIVFLLVYLSSCLGERSINEKDGEKDSTELKKDSTYTTPDEAMCFLRLDGTKNQDSTYVFIRLKGDSVSGVHHWVPNLKDARRGVITGTKRGDTIDVVWNYMQEGVSDTLHTLFLLQDGYLKQQAYAVTEEGKQVWDKDAPFDITYKPAPCPKYD